MQRWLVHFSDRYHPEFEPRGGECQMIPPGEHLWSLAQRMVALPMPEEGHSEWSRVLSSDRRSFFFLSVDECTSCPHSRIPVQSISCHHNCRYWRFGGTMGVGTACIQRMSAKFYGDDEERQLCVTVA